MRRIYLTIFLFTLLLGCKEGKINEEKINAAGDKLQKTVEKGADSIASKVGRFIDTLDKRNDTIVQ